MGVGQGAAGLDIVEDVGHFPQFKAVKNAQRNAETSAVNADSALKEMSGSQPTDAQTGRKPIPYTPETPLSAEELAKKGIPPEKAEDRIRLLCEQYKRVAPENAGERIRLLCKLYEETEALFLGQYLQGYGASWSAVPHYSALITTLNSDALRLSRQQLVEPTHIINLLAGIGAVWAIIGSGQEFIDSKANKNTLLRLHTVQVIGLIRLLKLSEQNHSFCERLFRNIPGVPGQKIMADGHMIQVGTGEGKSVLLGVLSCFLAMTGVHVRCACYSQYLSSRDYENFKHLFQKFNVESLIKYSTIEQLVNECINDKGDVRTLVLQHVSRVATPAVSVSAAAHQVKKILLIDEVRHLEFIACQSYV